MPVTLKLQSLAVATCMVVLVSFHQVSMVQDSRMLMAELDFNGCGGFSETEFLVQDCGCYAESGDVQVVLSKLRSAISRFLMFTRFAGRNLNP